jgi:hypothetical protein
MGYYTRKGLEVQDIMSKLEMKEKEHCGWCKYNEHRCTSEDVVATCDFRTLAQNKKSVLARINQEKEFLDKLKSEKMTEATAIKAVDILAGINIMIKYLEEEHGMKKETIMKKAGFPELNWAEKMKLIMKMKAMEKSRGK